MLPTDSGRTGPDTGGGRLMRAVGLALRGLLGAIGLIFIIALVVPLIAEMSEPSAEEETLARVEADMPRPRDYDHVALPVTAPPAGAMVQASRYRDGLQQDVRFMYQGFTVFACARHDRAPAEACRPRSSQILATHRDGAWLTHLYANVRARGAVLPAVAHFRAAEVTLQPAWVQEFARDDLIARYTPAQG